MEAANREVAEAGVGVPETNPLEEGPAPSLRLLILEHSSVALMRY